MAKGLRPHPHNRLVAENSVGAGRGGQQLLGWGSYRHDRSATALEQRVVDQGVKLHLGRALRGKTRR
jgi:hypothetical protein